MNYGVVFILKRIVERTSVHDALLVRPECFVDN